MNTEDKKYCGDCIFLRLKRNKGIVTGEHLCLKWDTLHSEFQPVGKCSYFIDKASPNLALIDDKEYFPTILCPNCGGLITSSVPHKVGLHSIIPLAEALKETEK